RFTPRKLGRAARPPCTDSFLRTPPHACFSNLLLDENLKVRSHRAGQNHLARVESKTRHVGLAQGVRALAFELFEQARAQQERVEAFELDGLKARGLARCDDLSPVDGRRQILLARIL